MRKALHYGKLEIVPKKPCDAYVLDNDMAVFSERGAANFLGVDHAHLVRMRQRGIPKILTQFMPPDFKIETIQAEVTATNSPYQGRQIVAYPVPTVENIMFAYVMAFGNQVLRKNQRHIGEYNVIMMTTLSSAALEATIKESCQLPVNIQATTRQHYQDIVTLMQESGLHCSVSKDIALKT
ncbi:hypothetical protein TI05_17020, partial [Achromatium sp. WMS3]